MLKALKTQSIRTTAGARFAIIASEYNAEYADSMVRAAETELKKGGAKHIEIIRVPGAFEIPLIAARLARISCEAAAPAKTSARKAVHVSRFTFHALICLGVILRGETVHAEHIGTAVTRALMELQLTYEIPVIHEVLLLENEAQARARCLDPNHNRGAEAAQTALSMVQVMSGIP